MSAAHDLPRLLILGCGYTGARVAQRYLALGGAVIATTRTSARLAALEEAGALVRPLDLRDRASVARLRAELPPDLVVLHSIPPLPDAAAPDDPTSAVLDMLADRIARIIYLSTTGVYGTTFAVDATTPVAPVTARQRRRVASEQAISAGPWSTLILRPAAIYGPNRGVHSSMREGRYRLVGAGDNINARIHVDDLASHVLAGIRSTIVGAYPVADQTPSPAREVAAFCAALLDLPLPPSVSADEVDETLRSSRSVDGQYIRDQLGITLQFPSYRSGIPAALAAEQALPGPLL